MYILPALPSVPACLLPHLPFPYYAFIPSLLPTFAYLYSLEEHWTAPYPTHPIPCDLPVPATPLLLPTLILPVPLPGDCLPPGGSVLQEGGPHTPCPLPHLVSITIYLPCLHCPTTFFPFLLPEEEEVPSCLVPSPTLLPFLVPHACAPSCFFLACLPYARIPAMVGPWGGPCHDWLLLGGPLPACLPHLGGEGGLDCHLACPPFPSQPYPSPPLLPPPPLPVPFLAPAATPLCLPPSPSPHPTWERRAPTHTDLVDWKICLYIAYLYPWVISHTRLFVLPDLLLFLRSTWTFLPPPQHTFPIIPGSRLGLTFACDGCLRVLLLHTYIPRSWFAAWLPKSFAPLPIPFTCSCLPLAPCPTTADLLWFCALRAFLPARSFYPFPLVHPSGNGCNPLATCHGGTFPAYPLPRVGFILPPTVVFPLPVDLRACLFPLSLPRLLRWFLYPVR